MVFFFRKKKLNVVCKIVFIFYFRIDFFGNRFLFWEIVIDYNDFFWILLMIKV